MRVKDLIRELEGFDSDCSVRVEYKYYDSEDGELRNSYSNLSFRKEVGKDFKLLIISKQTDF